MKPPKYKAAYERQKKAREKAENILESKSRELYDANQSLIVAYTKLKNQKSQILHQEKLASIGQLAAGVAHEINNPTGFVMGNISSMQVYISHIVGAIERYESALRKKSTNDADIEQSIRDIRQDHDLDYILSDIHSLTNESIEGLDRIGNIVSSLKDFSRPDNDTTQLFCLNRCIENTVRLVNNEIKYTANLALKLGEIAMISGQPGAISQVILNLIVNAADAISEKNAGKGTIEVQTTNDKNEVRLDVSDNGEGIPQNMITRVFDPFFTTKDVGKGTGLGLSVSHNIVENHGGRMAIDSKEGQGTTFSLFFPLPR